MFNHRFRRMCFLLSLACNTLYCPLLNWLHVSNARTSASVRPIHQPMLFTVAHDVLFRDAPAELCFPPPLPPLGWINRINSGHREMSSAAVAQSFIYSDCLCLFSRLSPAVILHWAKARGSLTDAAIQSGEKKERKKTLGNHDGIWTHGNRSHFTGKGWMLHFLTPLLLLLFLPYPAACLRP